tara:strand:- start:1100 stop:1642 length:543 start_codon:yes stop_codon:yes gene_type:complete
MSQIKVDSIVPRGGLPASASSGGIIQIVSTVCTATASMTLGGGSGNSAWFDISGMSCTITPQSASSKIFLMCVLRGAPAGGYLGVQLVRASTAIMLGTGATGNMSNVTGKFKDRTSTHHTYEWVHNGIDSPSTTSATTYKVQVANRHSTDAFYFNRPSTLDDSNYTMYTSSSFTVMELTA